MDIQNYIFATNFEPGREERCHYTGEMLDISETFFQTMEKQILGSGVGIDQMRTFRNEVQHQYAIAVRVGDVERTPTIGRERQWLARFLDKPKVSCF